MDKKLYRIPEQGMLTGLCAGLADYFKLDVTIVRLLAVLAVFVTSGFFVIVYIIAMFIVPVKDAPADCESVSQRVNTSVKELTGRANSLKFRSWLGVGLVLLGVWLVIRIFWPDWLEFRWDVIWPVALIFIGLMILIRGRK